MRPPARVAPALHDCPRSAPHRRRNPAGGAGLVALALMLAAAAASGPVAAQERKPGEVTASASLTGIGQLDSDLDGGGSFRWNGVVVAGSVTWQLSSQFAAGLNLRYDFERWKFAGPGALGDAAPWGDINRPAVGVNLAYQYASDLAVFVAPQIEWDYESGASTGNAQNYGAVVGATKVFSPKLILGLGAGVFRQIDETKVFPFVIVNWQIDDNWRLTNPLRAGPAGGAGLELAYALDANWELAGGGTYREYRFRLKDDGPVPGGIGENRGIPLFARLSRKIGPKGRVDLYAGAVVGGRLEVTSADGNTTTSSDYRAAPLFGLTAALDF